MSKEAAQSAVRDTVLDVAVEQLAKVYAQAALDAAGSEQDQGTVIEELETLGSQVLASFPDFQSVLSSALVSQEEKLEMIDRVFGSRLSTTTISFLKVLAAHNRLEYLPQVIRAASKMWEDRSGRIPVEIQLAMDTSPDLIQEMVGALRKRFNKEPVVKTVLNPDLLAGFVVRVGDQVLDASARTNFEHARNAMVAHAVEAIQHHPEQFFEK